MSAHLLPLPLAAPRSVSVLGSTGSIGNNTLDVIGQHPDRYAIVALTAHRNVEALIAQCHRFKPRMAVIGDEAFYPMLKEALAGSGTTPLAGESGLMEAAQAPADMTMAAMVGAAGLRPVMAAAQRGATLALANKESLVCAGELLTKACRASGTQLLPVDSEHNAIFQVFDAMQSQSVEHITLTASGGAFLNWPTEKLAQITPEQATKHPNWNMGAKITVDSSTMMNKALEMIEAFHLFPLAPEQIEVLIHPESIVHSLVHYCDGSVLAQLGLPDMRTPIAYALGWPHRLPLGTPRLKLADVGALHFSLPDLTRFRALALAQQAMKAGQWASIALNAANEVAVRRFLAGDIGFTAIENVVEETLGRVSAHPIASLDDVLAADQTARAVAEEIS